MILLLVALAWAQEPGDVPTGDLPSVRVEPPPRAGQESVVTVVDELDRVVPGATVQVVYRPGLSGEHWRAIGISDSRGRVRWTPEEGGVARIEAGDDELPVTVAWSEPPPSTITVLTILGFAATVLLGYGALSFPRRETS